MQEEFEDNQNPYFEEERTTQCPNLRKSTKGQTTIYKTCVSIYLISL